MYGHSEIYSLDTLISRLPFHTFVLMDTTPHLQLPPFTAKGHDGGFGGNPLGPNADFFFFPPNMGKLSKGGAAAGLGSFSGNGDGGVVGFVVTVGASILPRQSSTVLSKISSMATSRCGFSPKGESPMMSRSEERPTEDLNLEWKSLCSISMMRSWLWEEFLECKL